jgi:hypothetical protein
VPPLAESLPLLPPHATKAPATIATSPAIGSARTDAPRDARFCIVEEYTPAGAHDSATRLLQCHDV